jgi:hypothetical protein
VALGDGNTGRHGLLHSLRKLVIVNRNRDGHKTPNR